MNTSQVFVAISIAVLAVVAFIAFLLRKNRREDKLSPLVDFTLAFIAAGILFREERLLGYGFMVIGVILAVIDIFKKSMTG